MWHISCATYAHMPAGVRAGDVHSNFDKRDGETARPSLARRVPVVPGRPCPSRPSRRRVRRARRACRHRRPRRARRPRPAHGDPHSSREPPGPTDVAISAGTPRTPSSGFRDPEMSRMCRGPTVDSKNAGIHTTLLWEIVSVPLLQCRPTGWHCGREVASSSLGAGQTRDPPQPSRKKWGSPVFLA